MRIWLISALYVPTTRAKPSNLPYPPLGVPQPRLATLRPQSVTKATQRIRYPCAPMRRIAFVVLLFAASVAYAQQRDDAFLDDLERVRTFNAVAISPDGRHIAWSLHG